METTVDLLNQVHEFNSIHEFMMDDDVDETLAIIIKIIANPDVPATQAIYLINKLQAMSAKFGVLSTYYTNIAKGSSGTPNNIKKNVYYTLKDSLDKLVSALKYTANSNIH